MRTTRKGMRRIFRKPSTERFDGSIWAEEFLKRYPQVNADNIHPIIRKEIGSVFSRVLEDAGVYKRTPEGKAAFLRFIESL
mgnify:CR=1 FL=1